MIFDLFEQEDVLGCFLFGGFGFGFVICWLFVELYGGWIVVESDGFGYGVIFMVWLLIVYMMCVECVVLFVLVVFEQLVDVLLCIVVVDDNCELVDMFVVLLQLKGYVLWVVYNVVDVLVFVCDYLLQLMLFDLMMLDIDGFMLLQELCVIDMLCDMICVVLLGYVCVFDFVCIECVGFDDYFVKFVEMVVFDVLLQCVVWWVQGML